MRRYYCMLLLLCCLQGIAQNIDKTITGKVVTTGSGIAIANANLHSKRSGTTTVTESDGSFSIRLKYAVDTLVCSHINYGSTTIVINDKTKLQLVVNMEETANQLSDVQVSTGYQNVPRERSTGSFEKIDNKLLNQQTGINILNRLEAVANGIFFDRKTSSGSTNIVVRGLSTIQGPKDPLIILDNFPYEGSINNINPNDVESITILKDAAAASIWGTKAGNGVIVITTKKGQFNQSIKTEVNANIIVTDKPDLFYFKNISPSDFIDVEQFLYGKGYYNSQVSSTSRPPLSPVVELLIKKANGSLSATEADAKINALRNVDVRNDFDKYMYRQAVNQQYAVNMRGGGSNLAWVLSMGFDKNISELDAAYNRVNIRSSNTFRLSKQLQLTAGLYYTQSNSKAGKPGYNEVSTTNGRLPVYTQLADANGNALPVIKTYRQPYLDTVGGGKLLDWNYYPLTDYQYTDNSSKTQDVLANIGLSYKYNNQLSADIKYQYERQSTTGRILYDQQSYFVRDIINTYSQLNRATGVVTYKVPKGAILDNSIGLLESHSARGQVNYNLQKGNNSIAAIAGTEIRQANTTANSFRVYGYNNDILTYGNVDYANPYPNFITNSTSFINNGISYTDRLNRFVSFYGNAAYTFQSRYTVSLSGRRDASNLFGASTNDKWTPLWSTGAAWDISKEQFYKLPFLPYLKLRATYGISGNTDQSRSALTTLIYGNNSAYTQSPVARIGQYNNPSLRWEKVKMLNIGLDFKSKGERITGSIEYYHKKATDLFGNAPVDYTGVGTNYLTQNVASIKGNGVDIAINSTNTKGAIIWVTNLNLNFYKDAVVDYFLTSKQGSNFINGGTSISALVGNPVYAVYSYKWAGLDGTTGDPRGIYQGQISKDYTALTGSNTLIADLTYNGAAFPTCYGSLGNTVSWKGLSLTVRLTYKLGYWFQRSSINYNTLFSNRQGHADYALRWQQPGDELLTNVPSMVYPINTNRDNFYNNSEILVEKGDHIRLQYVTLSYDITKKQVRQLPFTNLQLYVNANNLGIIWKANKYGIDPDYLNSSLPASKNIAVGIRANF